MLWCTLELLIRKKRNYETLSDSAAHHFELYQTITDWVQVVLPCLRFSGGTSDFVVDLMIADMAQQYTLVLQTLHNTNGKQE